jgi:hypothetical protein
MQHAVDAPGGSVDAAVDSKSIDAPPAASFGLIEITQGTDADGPDSGVDIQFSNVAFGPVLGTDGPCTIYSDAESQRFSAGVLTITGTKQTLTATPDGTAPEVYYDTSPSPPTPLYDAGDSIQVSAAGGPDVPAFTATVTAPAALAGFTPPTTMSRSGYTATWTAGAGPTIWVIVGAFSSTSADAAIAVCRVTDTGSFTVPSSTFALVPANADTGFVGLGRVAPTTVSAGGTMVIVQAVNYLTSGEVAITN